MSTSIKEIIFKFIFGFLILFLLGYFIEFFQINFIKALALSLGISIFDLISYLFKKYKNKHI